MWPIFFLILTVNAEIEWTCPYLWKFDQSSKMCFKLFYRHVFTKTQAEVVCSAYNASLGVINSHETFQTVNDIIESGWRVSEGLFPYDRIWIASESSLNTKVSERFNITSRCVSFLPGIPHNASPAFIESIPCDITNMTHHSFNYVLCQANSATKKYVSLYCENGWSLFEDRKICHRLFQVGISSMEGAESFCQAHSANVSMLVSERERRFVIDLMVNGWRESYQTFPYESVWIRMNRTSPSDSKTFIWNNGTKNFQMKLRIRYKHPVGEIIGSSDIKECFTFTPWEMDYRRQEPASIDDSFSEISCDPWKYSLSVEGMIVHTLCEKAASEKKEARTTPAIERRTQPCTDEWHIFEEGKKCHKLLQVGITSFYGAKKLCEAEGGRLSSLETIKEVEFVTDLMRRGWKIGEMEKHLNYVWVSLTKVTGTWMWNEKHDFKEELGKVNVDEYRSSTCAALQPKHFVQKGGNYFGEIPCDKGFFNWPPCHVLCERDDHNRENSTNIKNEDCPIGWHLYANDLMCVKFLAGDTYSYQAAQDKCSTEGGNLVSANTKEKRDFITELTTLGWRPRLTDVSSSPIWVGLRKEGSIWRWINGEIFDDSLPTFTEDTDKKQCGVMFVKTLSWNSSSSDFMYVECDLNEPVEHLVCEKDSFVKTNKASQITARIAIVVILMIILLIFLVIIIRKSLCFSKQKTRERRTERKYSFEQLPSSVTSSSSLTSNLKSDIPLKNVEFIEKIGQGFFGVVWRAKLHHPKEFNRLLEVAVKQVRYTDNAHQSDALVSEIKFLSKIGSHPNVIKFIGTTASQNSKHRNMLIMEYCPRGNLRDHLHSIGKKSYINISTNDSILINFSLQIARGMEFISSIPCIHRDLAARNILLTNNFTCKITDFGLAKNEEYYKGSPSCGLPYRWMSPEAIESKRFTEKSDVWSFGIVLLEIFSFGSTPYADVPPREVIPGILSGRVNKIPLRTPEKIGSLINKCWQFQPQCRPTFTECVSVVKEHLVKNDPVMLCSMNSEEDETLDFQNIFDEGVAP